MNSVHVLVQVSEHLLRQNFLETEVFLLELEEDRFGSGRFWLGCLVGGLLGWMIDLVDLLRNP